VLLRYLAADADVDVDAIKWNRYSCFQRSNKKSRLQLSKDTCVSLMLIQSTTIFMDEKIGALRSHAIRISLKKLSKTRYSLEVHQLL
jgi:hypothetical protein